MLIEIRSFRGIDRADISLDPKITLLVGDNGVGKTNFVEGITAACMADGNFLKVKKDQGFRYVHRGAKEGSVTVKDEHGTRRVSYPTCEVKSLDGAAHLHGPIAMGVQVLSALTPTERAKVLEPIINQKVDRERLDEELKECKVFDNDRKKILDTVFGDGKLPGMGWEQGASYAAKEATARKALFKQVAGCVWGVNQGLTFFPPGWELDLDKAKLEDLQKTVVDARENHDKVIRQNAYAEVDLQKLMDEADSIEQLEKDWHEAGLKYEKTSAALVGYKANLTAAEADAHLIKCNNCGIQGTIKDQLLIERKKVAQHDSATLTELRKKVSDTEALAVAQRFETTSLQNKIADAKKAKGKLEEAKKVEPTAKVELDVDAAKQAIRTAESRLKAFEAKHQGVAYHRQIEALLAAAAAMGPDGLRKRVLISNLKPFNDKLAEVCRAAGWGTVTIDSDLEINVDGEPFVFCCESEQMRANLTIQLAIASLTNAPLVVIDRANILERKALNQLFGALMKLNIRALVAISRSIDKDGNLMQVVDLGSFNPPRGATYWVKNKTIVPFAAQLALAK